MPTGQPSSGAGPAIAMSPPRFTSTPRSGAGAAARAAHRSAAHALAVAPRSSRTPGGSCTGELGLDGAPRRDQAARIRHEHLGRGAQRAPARLRVAHEPPEVVAGACWVGAGAVAGAAVEAGAPELEEARCGLCLLRWVRLRCGHALDGRIATGCPARAAAAPRCLSDHGVAPSATAGN